MFCFETFFSTAYHFLCTQPSCDSPYIFTPATQLYDDNVCVFVGVCAALAVFKQTVDFSASSQLWPTVVSEQVICSGGLSSSAAEEA